MTTYTDQFPRQKGGREDSQSEYFMQGSALQSLNGYPQSLYLSLVPNSWFAKESAEKGFGAISTIYRRRVDVEVIWRHPSSSFYGYNNMTIIGQGVCLAYAVQVDWHTYRILEGGLNLVQSHPLAEEEKRRVWWCLSEEKQNYMLSSLPLPYANVK